MPVSHYNRQNRRGLLCRLLRHQARCASRSQKFTLSAPLPCAGLPNTSMTPPLPVQRSFRDPTAPVYVTAGGGGPPGPDGGAGTAPGVRFGSEQYSTGRLVAHNATHLTWKQVANADGGVLDTWTIVQTQPHGEFHPGPTLPPPPPPPPPPPSPPAPPVVAVKLQLVALDICRHYWNWVCKNASLIPGGVEGGGQAACCMANTSDPFFSWRDQGSHALGDLVLYTTHPASAYPVSYWQHTVDSARRPPLSMPDYRMGDYAETSYFGPIQGVGGVWTGVVNFSAAGFGKWNSAGGAPLALYDPGVTTGGGKEWLAEPRRFELLLSGPNTAALPDTSPIAVWRPIPPEGYTALGAVITTGQDHMPPTSSVRVLKDECVAQCPARLLWCDAKQPDNHCGAGGQWSMAVYSSSGASSALSSGAIATNLLFVATNSSSPLQTVPCINAACVGV